MYSSNVIKKVQDYGKYQYNIDQILILLAGDVDAKKFRKDFTNKNSEIYLAYHKGKMNAELTIDKALHAAAAKGNTNAIEMIRIRNLNNAAED
jgi:hypothetical protein